MLVDANVFTAACLQKWLAALLLLLLVQCVVPNVTSAGAARRRRNSAKGHRVQLIEVVLVVDADPRRFSTVLGDIRHLLLLGQHLNLRLLLLGDGKEIVQHVLFRVILGFEIHIFCSLNRSIAEWIAFVRALPLVRLVGQLGRLRTPDSSSAKIIIQETLRGLLRHLRRCWTTNLAGLGASWVWCGLTQNESACMLNQTLADR